MTDKMKPSERIEPFWVDPRLESKNSKDVRRELDALHDRVEALEAKKSPESAPKCFDIRNHPYHCGCYQYANTCPNPEPSKKLARAFLEVAIPDFLAVEDAEAMAKAALNEVEKVIEKHLVDKILKDYLIERLRKELL